MTDFEFKFPRQVTAGSKAFQMGILRQNNPYKDKKNRDAWDRGYSAAKRKYEADRFRQEKEAQREAIDAGFGNKAPVKRTFVRSGQKPFTPTDKQFKQFNSKFRTVS